MILSTTHSPLADGSTLEESSKLYRQRFLIICVLYLAIASLLAVLVRYGVMDEDFHLTSGKPFVNSGLNRNTLYSHIPPTGVASHLWYALWMWLFPGINYVGLRLVNCAVITSLAVFTYVHLKTISVASQRKVLVASWFMLISPYFFLSTSTAMTEGPALLFLFAGLLLLFISQLRRLLPLFLACLLLGLATIARFYFIPLLPTLLVVFILSDRQQYVPYDFRGFITNKLLPFIFIGIGLLPLAGLIFLWGGLTPPSFNKWSQLRSGVSFNALRPISTLILVGVYIAPVVLFNVSAKSALLRRSLIIALLIALVLAAFQINLFHTSSIEYVFSGPIEHGLAQLKSRGDLALCLGLFGAYSLSFLSLTIILQQLLYFSRMKQFTDKGLLFSVVFVIFFVASQAFVGGNHPFYERYLIHPWPFIGYIVAVLFPAFLNVRTYLIMVAYTILSVVLLIKWGMG